MIKPLKANNKDYYTTIYEYKQKKIISDLNHNFNHSNHVSNQSNQFFCSCHPSALLSCYSSSPSNLIHLSISNPEKKVLYTVDPTCIFNNHIVQNLHHNISLDEKVSKITNFNNNNNNNNHTDSCLEDIINNQAEGKTYISEFFATDPIIFQEYLNSYEHNSYAFDNQFEDSLYTNKFQNDTFDSTSFELDSNITSNITPNDNSTNYENINPVFFHHTPSPKSKSIRIITSSNRIEKLKDKKLINAINRSLNLKKKFKFEKDFKINARKTNINTSISSSPCKRNNEISISNQLKLQRPKNPFVDSENAQIKKSSLNNSNLQGRFKFDNKKENLNENNKFAKRNCNHLNDNQKNIEIINKISNNNINELTSKIQFSQQIFSLKHEIKWKNDFKQKKLKENTKTNNTIDKLQINENSNIEEQKKNEELVMELFRKSMKKNKDCLPKTKTQDKTKSPITKVTKLIVPRCSSKFKDPSINQEKDIFKCTQCSKVFKQRSQWKRHVDCIHLKIAKFICIKCGKAFKRSDHLKNHIRRIHGA